MGIRIIQSNTSLFFGIQLIMDDSPRANLIICHSHVLDTFLDNLERDIANQNRYFGSLEGESLRFFFKLLKS